MEYRQLGASGLRVPVLSFGAATFGGKPPFFSAWGTSDAAEARRLVDICLEAGVNLFDTADVYSNGASEEVLGEGKSGPTASAKAPRDEKSSAGRALTSRPSKSARKPPAKARTS